MPTSLATTSSRSAPSRTRSPPRRSSSTWRKKKRIRRGRRDLPALQPDGRVPLPPLAHLLQSRGVPPLPPRLLPLPLLWQGTVPLRPRRGADDPRPDAGLGAGRHLGRGGRRQLREGG